MKSITVVLPVYNESESLRELTGVLDEVLTDQPGSYELLFVDDGSTDDSLACLRDLAKTRPYMRIVQNRKNFGKAIALDTGFKMAVGDIVITMDSDLQDDPREIPAMLAKLDEGYDLISGWKKERNDPLGKTLPSKLFNAVTAWISGLPLHDFNCGFKTYRREVVENLNIYGDMHRYIPALAYWKGFRVAEIPVRHHARKYGNSKYGLERFLRGLFDFLTIAFITKFKDRPMHFFGVIGLIAAVLGFIPGFYLIALWLVRVFGGPDYGPFGTRPLLFFSILMIIVAMLFFSTGLLAEMIISLTCKREVERHVIKRVISFPTPPAEDVAQAFPSNTQPTQQDDRA